MVMRKEVVVRIPPSPTGLLHIGTVRTALYNYLFAKKHGGKIIMRFEDTDRERSTKEFEENILSGLKRLGLHWDGEVFHQSERTALYRKHLEELLKQGKVYYCFCTKEELEEERKKREINKLPPRYSGKCSSLSHADQEEKLRNGMSGVIRFRVPENKDVAFEDHVRGNVSVNTRDLDDFVIAKDLDSPLYNFCVVVDDHEMAVSHVIRGEDHIPNTPKQILISEAFGWSLPEFAHLPLILNADKSKLSKRKNKVSVDDYLNEGYLPEALLNFLALVGWNTPDENEIFSLQELIEAFSLERVHKGGAVFDLDKLLWLNGFYIRGKSLEELDALARPFLQEEIFVSGRIKFGDDFFLKALSLVHERCKKLSELPDLLRFFYVENLEYPKELYLHEKMGVTPEIALKAIQEGISLLSDIPEGGWNEESIKEILLKKIGELGWKNGQMLWPLRVALTGEKFSPGTFELLAVFGKERSLDKLRKGVSFLSA